MLTICISRERLKYFNIINVLFSFSVLFVIKTHTVSKFAFMWQIDLLCNTLCLLYFFYMSLCVSECVFSRHNGLIQPQAALWMTSIFQTGIAASQTHFLFHTKAGSISLSPPALWKRTKTERVPPQRVWPSVLECSLFVCVLVNDGCRSYTRVPKASQ